MRIAMIHYSATGNTLLACRYLEQRLPGARFDYIDCARDPPPCLDAHVVVGLAGPTFFLGMPPALSRFIGSLPRQEGKPAFLLNTYGMMSGKTLMRLDAAARQAGLRVFAAHSLPVPESYPPFLAKGWANAGAPREDDLRRFDAFVAEVGDGLERIHAGLPLERARIRVSLLEKLIPAGTPKKARKEIGLLSADTGLCDRCGECARVCPNGAARLSPLPVFSPERCEGCWACWNRCPRGAVVSTAFGGTVRYRQDSAGLAARLSSPRPR